MLKFEFSPAMIEIIGRALQELPYRSSAPVLAEIQRQINLQIDVEYDEVKFHSPDEK